MYTKNNKHIIIYARTLLYMTAQNIQLMLNIKHYTHFLEKYFAENKNTHIFASQC